jgi:hypothetical protein
MHVVTPVSGSTSATVVAGSHTVGGNIGTHVSPCSIVNGPHVAALTVRSAGSQRPSRSTVPSPQSTLWQPAPTRTTRRPQPTAVGIHRLFMLPL